MSPTNATQTAMTLEARSSPRHAVVGLRQLWSTDRLVGFTVRTPAPKTVFLIPWAQDSRRLTVKRVTVPKRDRCPVGRRAAFSEPAGDEKPQGWRRADGPARDGGRHLIG